MSKKKNNNVFCVYLYQSLLSNGKSLKLGWFGNLTLLIYDVPPAPTLIFKRKRLEKRE